MAIEKPVNLYGYEFSYHRLVKLTVDLVPPSPNPGVSAGIWELLFGIYASEAARRAGEQPAGAERIVRSDPPAEVLAAFRALQAEIYKWVTAPQREITASLPRMLPMPAPEPGSPQIVPGQTAFGLPGEAQATATALATAPTMQGNLPGASQFEMQPEVVIDPSSVTPYNGLPEV